MSDRRDLVVIGAGPGGYVAAIRAAQLGMRVAVVEEDQPGGVCLNWGCIPSKAILGSAELYEEVRRHGDEHGLRFEGLSVDFAPVIERSRRAAERLVRGVKSLFKKNGVELVRGRGRLVARDAVDTGQQRLQAENILLATGSRERLLPGVKLDAPAVMTSRQALETRERPGSVVIIGGGPIGLEFGYVYAAFGSEVTVVEMTDQLLPGTDVDVARELERQLDRQGIRIRTGTSYRSHRRKNGRVVVEVESEDKRDEIIAESMLLAVGRVPLSDGIGLETVGVETERGFVKVDGTGRTGVPGIWAIGDLIGPPLLAHKASSEGVLAVENMHDGGSRRLDPRHVPACVYCQPEVATVGLSEAQAREEGYEVEVGKIPFAAIGKAVAVGHPEGFVKLVRDARYGEVLGCHIVGHGATDLIAEVTTAMTLETTTTELGEAVHAHPTLSESIMEAALAAESRSINF